MIQYIYYGKNTDPNLHHGLITGALMARSGKVRWRVDALGNVEMLSRELIIKEKPPDWQLALRWLAVMDPESWAESAGDPRRVPRPRG